MSIDIYAFYNNKGGVGKTTLCTNVAALFAEQQPTKQVLVIDMCPQANASQFFLGGGERGYRRNQELQSYATRKNVVGFVDWLLKGNSSFKKPNTKYGVKASDYNRYISENLFLIAGDSFLEALSLPINYAVLNPGNLQAWPEYMSAIKRLCEHEVDDQAYDGLTVFIDCNPSFSIYTQMALASSNYIVVPMMADYSSAEGIKSIFTLLYGVSSSAGEQYAKNIATFNKQIDNFELDLPVIWEFVFNNYTANLGVATAYDSIKSEIIDVCFGLYKKSPHLFADATPKPKQAGQWAETFLSDVKDFHTAGKVSASLGIPLHRLPSHTKYEMPNGQEVPLPKGNYKKALEEIQGLTVKIR